MTKFRKGQLDVNAFKVLMFDLGCISVDDEDEKYHHNLLKGNLQDIFGKKVVLEYEAEQDGK